MSMLSDYQRLVEKPAQDDYRAQISGLTARSAARRHALMLAREKLAIYRAAHGGEYLGGMEYSALMKLIDEAIG